MKQLPGLDIGEKRTPNTYACYDRGCYGNLATTVVCRSIHDELFSDEMTLMVARMMLTRVTAIGRPQELELYGLESCTGAIV